MARKRFSSLRLPAHTRLVVPLQAVVSYCVELQVLQATTQIDSHRPIKYWNYQKHSLYLSLNEIVEIVQAIYQQLNNIAIGNITVRKYNEWTSHGMMTI